MCDALITTANTPIDDAFSDVPRASPLDACRVDERDDDTAPEVFGDSLLADLRHELLIELAHTAYRATSDHERVRANAVRALGHFGRFAPLDVLLGDAGRIGENPSLLAAIVSALCVRLTSGSAKVRWNSCYALVNLFQFKITFFTFLLKKNQS